MRALLIAALLFAPLEALAGTPRYRFNAPTVDEKGLPLPEGTMFSECAASMVDAKDRPILRFYHRPETGIAPGELVEVKLRSTDAQDAASKKDTIYCTAVYKTPTGTVTKQNVTFYRSITARTKAPNPCRFVFDATKRQVIDNRNETPIFVPGPVEKVCGPLP